MQKGFLMLFCSFLLIITMSYKVEAHPGGTDSNGGHRCWTNCEQWGLKYGEYHYSNGSVSNNNDAVTAPDTTNNTIDQSSPSIEEQCQQGKLDGYNAAYDDALSGNFDNSYEWTGTEEYNRCYRIGLDEGAKRGKEVYYSNLEKEQNSKKDGFITYIDDKDKGKTVETLTIKLPSKYFFNSSVAFQAGYKAGFTDFHDGYNYDENDDFYSSGITLSDYQKGYKIGWIRSGGGNSLELFYFEYTYVVYIVGSIFLIGIIGIINFNRKKKNRA
jgi:hypothetical protein